MRRQPVWYEFVTIALGIPIVYTMILVGAVLGAVLAILLCCGCAMNPPNQWITPWNSLDQWIHVTRPTISTGPGWPSAQAKREVTGK